MKKIIILSIFSLFAINLFSQKISNLSPTLIVWKNNNERISLRTAHYGVCPKDSISLYVYFSKYKLNKLYKSKNFSLEFRWYYYLSTRKTLMRIDKLDYKKAQKLKNNIVLFKSTQKVLQPGWWEVQILNTDDNGYLEIGNVYKFQIFIKN
jgi:hypothetical protein